MSSTVTYKGSTIASVSNNTKKLNTSGKYMEDDVTITDVSQATPVLETVTKSYTPTETAQSETITAGAGYDGISEVDVSVGAISSSYVGSGITRRSSSDMTASGATVTAPSGYYENNGTKSVASGTVTAPASISATGASVSTGTNTLTLSKTVSVTPNVTTAGYISSGTAGNSSVSLSASVNIRSSSSLTETGGTVTAPAGYYASAATKAVAAGTAGTPTATKGTVSNHSVAVTPSVTNTTGYITGSTKTGTAVTVTASELASGNKAITSNGTGIDVVGYSTVSVDVAGGGSGSVYQDAEGYLVLSDEPGTHVEIDELQVTQNGTYTAPTGHAYSPVVVNVSGGGGGVEEKQINFYDYDGTLVDSYSAAEWANVSALPANPSHTGLTAQGWNWTKAQIDAQLTALPGGYVDVGQMYITADGKTEIDIELDDPKNLSPYLTFAPNGTVVVDWGDGSSTNTVTGTALYTSQYVQHSYASVGAYTIKLTVTNGTFGFRGSSADYDSPLTYTTGTSSESTYREAVKAVRLGTGTTAYNGYCFRNCYGLKYVTMPNHITKVTDYFLENSRSLKHITVPSSVTEFGSNGGVVRNSGLATISIPPIIATIPKYFAYGCASLKHATISTNCTRINTYAFSGTGIVRVDIYNARIEGDVFRSCKDLVTANILSFTGSLYLNQTEFYEDERLRNVIIPSNCTNIETQGFYHCASLQAVTIPSSVTTINNYAFSDTGLREVHLLPTTPPTVSANSFQNLISESVVFYVPYSADHSILEAYQTATNWSTYASYMQEEPQ